MDGRKGLRQRWEERTDAAFERMFAGKSEEELRTLWQRETMAELIGRELAAFLLEEHVATDETAHPPGGLLSEVQPGRKAGGGGREVAGANSDNTRGGHPHSTAALAV
jgi:hypothetical protein